MPILNYISDAGISVYRTGSWLWRVVTKRKGGGGTIRAASASLAAFLAGRIPGGWASDHMEETTHMTGWNFIAVRAASTAVSSATVRAVARPGTPAHAALLRKTDKRVSRYLRKAAELKIKALHGNPGGRRSLYAAAGRMELKAAALSQTATPDQPADLAETHPLTRLINRPNPGQSTPAFLFQVTQQICLTGSALVWAVRDAKNGVPVELYCIPTALTRPQPPTPDHPYGSYYVSPIGSQAVGVIGQFGPDTQFAQLLITGGYVDARDVRPVRWPHPVFLTDGLSPLSAGSRWVDISDQMDEAVWYGFKNQANPGMIFERDATVGAVQVQKSDIDQFLDDLKARASGTQNQYKTLIPPPGFKPTKWERNLLEADYIRGREQEQKRILALHNTPPVAVGVSEAGSYAQWYAALVQYNYLKILPICRLIGQELTAFLIQDGEGVTTPGLAIVVEPHEKVDPTVLEQRIVNDTRAYSITKNEVRKLRGMPPVPWGDEPAGIIPAKFQPKPAQLGPAGPNNNNPTGKGGRPNEPAANPVTDDAKKDKEKE